MINRLGGDVVRRVLMIAYHFPPVGGPGVQRIAKMAKYLPEHGWQPYVLTKAAEDEVDYPQDLSLREGIHPDAVVTHLHLTPLEKRLFRLGCEAWKQRVGRALMRLSLFSDSHRPLHQSAVKEGQRLIHDHDLEAIISTDPISAHLVGYRLHELTGLPWIMDVRDLWTEAFTYRPASYLHGLFDAAVERRMMHAADAIVCVTDGFQRKLRTKYAGIDPDRFVVIRNGYDEDDFKHRMLDRSDKFTLSYVGSLYDFYVHPRPEGWRRFFEPALKGSGASVCVRSPRPLLEAVQQFLQEHPNVRSRLCIQFIGAASEKDQSIVSDLDLHEVVTWTGYVPHSEAVEKMIHADVLFLMQAGAGSEVVVPGKLYEYLRSGTAILGLLSEGEAPWLIRETNTGVVLNPFDVDGIAAQIQTWYKCWIAGEPLSTPDWDQIKKYRRDRQASELSEIFEEVLKYEKGD